MYGMEGVVCVGEWLFVVVGGWCLVENGLTVGVHGGGVLSVSV